MPKQEIMKLSEKGNALQLRDMKSFTEGMILDRKIGEINRSTEDKQKEIFDKLQLINELKEVRSPIREVLSSDFVLATFSEKQKEFITETLKNAVFARNVILMFTHGKRYIWNRKKQDWEKNEDGSFKKFPLEEEEIMRIKSFADELFKSYMIMPLSIAVMERNKKGNFLLRLLVTGAEEREQEEQAKQEARSTAERIVDYIKGKKPEEGTEEQI